MTGAGVCGALMLICAGGLTGLKLRGEVTRRRRILEALAESVGYLKTETEFSHSPPDEIARRLAEEDGDAAPAFRFLADGDTCPELPLKKEELDELRRMRETISRCDRAGAIEQIGGLEAHCRAWAQSARENEQGERKLRMALCVSAAALAAILLL